jgi:hypothetical protein
LNDQPPASHSFDARSIRQEAADDLLALRRDNRLDNRCIVESTQEIALGDCDLAIANREFYVTLRKSDSDDPTGAWKEVAVA